MTTVLFAGGDDYWPDYEVALAEALDEAGVAARVVAEAPPETVDYIVYSPFAWLHDFTPYTRLKAVLNLWAGVESVVGNDSLRVPLARMVDPGMTEGMVDYCVAHVMRHHTGLDADVTRAPGDWNPRVPPLARERRVGVLGLGELGGAVADALAGLNFDVAGWSRSPKRRARLRCLHGDAGLREILETSEILVLLLPLTDETRDLLDARRLALLPRGAVLINPGRGALVVDDALIDALDRGAIGHATLDVFRQEPLPGMHPFWTHPRVTVTPHIASATRPRTASRVIAENLRRAEAGEPLLHLVDRDAGY